MPLRERLEGDLLAAIKTKNEISRDVLRGLKSAIKNQEIELQTEQLNDAEIEQVVAREAKRRKESIEAYGQANKPELAAAEQAELAILQAYLPEQISEEELAAIVKAAVAELGEGATIGAVMGKLGPELKGKADMGAVSRLVSQLIA
ncbi:MAG: GatB/YqeY domain-containing protein [Patescibacteria group bacterium]